MSRKSSSPYFVLDGHTVREADLPEWIAYFAYSDRQLAHTAVGDIHVSTVFLGLDIAHQIFKCKPRLFETMIFGGAHDLRAARYATWDEALAGHWQVVARLEAGLTPWADL